MRKTFRLFIAILFVLCFSCLTVACNDTNNTDVSFTLRFDANGGIGSMQDLIFKKMKKRLCRLIRLRELTILLQAGLLRKTEMRNIRTGIKFL